MSTSEQQDRATASGQEPGATLGPFTLKSVLQERLWGVERLPAWLEQPAPGRPVGEAWLTAETCRAEGFGRSGETLGELAQQFPERLGNSDGHGFPLLIKLLFPREKLSVQVHPDDEQAKVMGMPRGKTECWYVLDAEPGAEVAVGLRDPLPMVDVERAIADGTLEEKLRYLAVRAGDMVYVDAGTIHAIGPGMTVLETQQYSDTTYRLYDYGRPRDLHVAAGLAVSRAETAAGLSEPIDMGSYTRRVSSPYFVVDRFHLEAGQSAALGKDGELQILIALGEGCTLQSAHEGQPRHEAGGTLSLKPGQAAVLPAQSAPCSLRASGEVEVMRIAQS